MRALSPAEAGKRRGLRRMKAVASAALVVATLVYVLARWQSGRGAGWAGYVEAAAEAAMIGALADWFAVTALFRRPLGLPIPHTAIIPNRKEALGRSLGEFVGENFLSESVVRTRLRAVGLSTRLGAWLSDPAHADRLAHEAGGMIRGALSVLDDDKVRQVLTEALTRRLEAMPAGPPAGRLLARYVEADAHRPVVNLLAQRGVDWLVDHPEAIEQAVESEAPGWTPRFLDERLARRVHRELLRVARAVRDEPNHAARRAVDAYLAKLADDLCKDPEVMASADRFKNELLTHPATEEAAVAAWAALRRMILEGFTAEDGDLRGRLSEAVRSLGQRLNEDARLREKADGWVEGAAVYVVSTYRSEITALITDTVNAWDGEETSRKIEIQIGRDLQFIRINGTVVGALAGLLIYTLTRLSDLAH
ncbi:DUF445 domain-containing protein [Actinospica sp.]|uniref:DUF445 domain-containing protein n=1 Tax=Actinospica sp. TaxID=1872142 RepID=UPI002D1D1921|nr:DUF445 domain-containing protein [Actinospica sp.]HWG24828.1 DUF445 domain-containing protein [Actinospica sp.]